MPEEIYVDCGNGGYWLNDWKDLWEEMFRSLSFAIHFSQHGECKCGCDTDVCVYCIHECF